MTREDGRALPTRTQRFSSFCAATEPRLRRTLVATYGVELGSEAAADALAWAWEHFERIEAMDNPAGYLWRVGQTSVRGSTRRRTWTAGDGAPGGATEEKAFEPTLLRAMAALPHRQRTAVLLVHGYGYSLSEAAEAMSCRIRTLRHHLDRGLARVRLQLGVANDG